MIHFYGMTETAVMAMPIRRFWLFMANIDRIMAQGDLRALMIGASAQNGETAKSLHKKLEVELGEIQELEANALPAQFYEERDQEGFNQLKLLM